MAAQQIDCKLLQEDDAASMGLTFVNELGMLPASDGVHHTVRLFEPASFTHASACMFSRSPGMHIRTVQWVPQPATAIQALFFYISGESLLGDRTWRDNTCALLRTTGEA